MLVIYNTVEMLRDLTRLPELLGMQADMCYNVNNKNSGPIQQAQHLHSKVKNFQFTKHGPKVLHVQLNIKLEVTMKEQHNK